MVFRDHSSTYVEIDKFELARSWGLGEVNIEKQKAD